ncbi:uncharacterized protein MONOS_6137 [Monocercomonoides exilis]|uniref:uncharacterized protein n=1 Tax=Monocercomonoides exilis TaxID=2049356 RepID=UPI00355A4E38|nr:hypothetical protein MONOS_6137 [Monocercomonoides exilis]|eukprot:MONOS_6137.1-p1 / transcript=MONOS_6137.1 / gene=MONOS_6137 / organism=Monocercomonoides_exilis_PA203 / gene_product=unspecified product / transcript_product=unspecified product / location=Mono_scaffold00189:67550-68187(-) / protein_length=193 / sequence_SO=supercontig / SO=protein_coding / is_pseudo=false
MKLLIALKLFCGAKLPSTKQTFWELFNGLERLEDADQKAKIEEIYELINEMDKKMFNSFFTGRVCGEINRMIEDKKIDKESAIWLLRHVGYCKVLKKIWSIYFEGSSLDEKLEELIIEEEKKKEEKNEDFLVGLCECYLMLHNCLRILPKELISICVHYLLKVALNKEEDEETHKEVEMAVVALSSISNCQA